MNNDTFLIENYDIELAQEICNTINDELIRNRAVASVLGANIAEKYFTETEVDTQSGLHNIAFVQEKLEISDIYIKNNYIDVRVYFNDNELCVPKIHFDKDILPLAYMFIKLNEDISGATVTGFIMPSAINTDITEGDYYPVNETDLISYYDIEAMISEGFTYDIDDDVLITIFEYIDGKIDDDGHFYRTLLASKEARKRLYETIKAKYKYSYISKSQDFENTEVLDNLETENKKDNLENEDLQQLETNSGFEPLDEIEPCIDSLDEDNNAEEEMLIEEDCLDLTLEDNEDFNLEPTLDIVEEIIPKHSTLTESGDENIILEEQFIEEEEEEISDIENVNTEELLIEESFDASEPIENEKLEITDENIEENIPHQEWDEEVNLSEVSELLTDYNTEDNSQVENKEEAETQLSDTDSGITIETDSQDSFEYTTEVSPSIKSYDNNFTSQEEVNDTELLELLDNDSQAKENTPVETSDANSKQIDVLFNENDSEYESDNGQIEVTTNKKPSKLLPIISILTITAIGYYTYTKIMNTDNEITKINRNNIVASQNKTEAVNSKNTEAMPNETVENTKQVALTNEGTAESIPAIEDNLDASILISNLRVSWEVPVSYASNNTAKRYFTKLGKIIQLNLKTEMLLLNKPPITNKIAVELEFNKSNQNFIVKGITTSSGEKIVDDLIQNTVKNSLDINLNMDLSSFNNIQGNPTLIINL